MFYTLVISTAAIIIAATNFWGDGKYTLLSFGEMLLITLLAIAAVFLVDAVAATVCPSVGLPPKPSFSTWVSESVIFTARSASALGKNTFPNGAASRAFTRTRCVSPITASTSAGFFWNLTTAW